MTRQVVLEILSKALPDLRVRFGVSTLALFGSVARDEAGPESDVDLLVAFEWRAHFRAFMGLQFALEELLGAKVDLVTVKALRPFTMQFIENDLIDVA